MIRGPRGGTRYRFDTILVLTNTRSVLELVPRLGSRSNLVAILIYRLRSVASLIAKSSI